MIRRDVHSADGTPAWLLISQQTHAQLAGELASVWETIDDGVLSVGYIASVVYLHDDGWEAWEQAPTIDPATGVPRSFLEMPHEVAIDIWRRSIDGIADLGPLAQFMVAEHFCRLRRAADTEHDDGVCDFLETYEARSRDWLFAWQAKDPERRTAAAAERAVRWLQFFDRLSLWVCMAQRTTPETFEPPARLFDAIEITPKPPADAREHFAIQPWPLQSLRCEMNFGGQPMIAARRYASDADLHTAIAGAPRVMLKWAFDPC